jgi:hypothetical protein
MKPAEYPTPFALYDENHTDLINPAATLCYNGVSFYFRTTTRNFIAVLNAQVNRHYTEHLELWSILSSDNQQLIICVDAVQWYQAADWLKREYGAERNREENTQ